MYGGTRSEMLRLLADAERLTGVKYDINNLNDVYNAIHAIQENLGITGTTAKEAEETLIGSFNSMKAAATDFLGNLALGMDIKEPMANMITTASTFLFGNLLPMIGNVFKAIPESLAIAFQTLGPQMAAAGRNLMQQLGVGLSENSPLNDFIPKMQQSLAPIGDAFKQAFGQLPGLFSTIAQAVIPIIETIASGLTRLDFSGFQNLITAIIPAVSNAFQTFMSIVGPAIDTVVNSFVNMWNAAQPLISVLASALMPVLQVLASFLGGVVKGALLGIAGMFDMVKIAIQFLTPIVSALVSVFSFVAPVLSKIAEWVGVAIGLFANFGTSGLNLKAIMQSAWNNIKTSIFIAKSGISSAINGIKSFFRSLGSAGGSLRNLLKTAWNAIKSAITSSGNAIRSVISRIKSFFSNLGSAGNSLRSALSSAWNAIRGAVTSAASGVISRVNAVKNIFNSLRNINLFSAGAAIMRGFLDGLKSVWSSVKNFVGGIADWIKDHKGPIQYDRKLLIPAGKAIMQGLNNGLVKNFKPIMDNVNQMSQDIIDSFATDVTPINLKTNDLTKSTLGNALPVDLAQELNVGSKAYQINQQAMLNRLDAQMTTITSLLSELSDKDIEVYMDGQKVSGIVEPIITANQEKATKYYNRRRGVFA